MKKVLFAMVCVALIGASAYAGYLYGWYQGLWYEAVASHIADATIGISLRSQLQEGKRDEALQLINSGMIENNLNVLKMSEAKIPGKFKVSYERLKIIETKKGN